MDSDVVLFLRVGAHDATLRWGERADLRKYGGVVDPTRFTSSLPPLPSRPTEAMLKQEPQLDDIWLGLPQLSEEITQQQPDFLEGYREGTIEDWMVFLSPLQRSTAYRSIRGPARVTGGPGTGKTVVALHHVVHLLSTLGAGSTLLIGSQIRTLPPILKQLFGRLHDDPEGAVEFTHIVDMARDVVRRHEGEPHLDEEKAHSVFNDVWARERDGPFRHEIRDFDPVYAWEEVRRVILGRVIPNEDAYLQLKRHGRRRSLSLHQRRALWHVAGRYEMACQMASPRIYDADSLVRRGYQLLRDSRLPVAFDAIVIDEAQDLTETALRFLIMQLADHHAGRLLLVGDGGQSIYPGGYRLSDLGIETRGRSTVLRDAYRSTDGILDAIALFGRAVSSQDFGEDGLGAVDLKPRRSGPPPRVSGHADLLDERLAIMNYLASLPEDGRAGVALLVLSNRLVREWAQWLKAVGLPARRLDDYEGVPVSGIKVGTYARSKGLEFERVVLPGLNLGEVPAVDIENEDTYFLQARQLYVAMSRARDELWMSYAGTPSLLIEELVERYEPDGSG